MAQLLPEGPILLPEIVAQVFLVAIHPAATVSTRKCRAWGTA